MNCRFCGAEVEEGAKFCQKCGKNLEEVSDKKIARNAVRNWKKMRSSV